MGKKRVIKKSGEAAEDTEKKPRGTSGATRVSRSVSHGIAHILATYNNTIIMITDESGNSLAWSSSGSVGFSGTKKATPFAAARVAETVAEKVRKFGLKSVRVRVKGVGSGRDSAIRALANHGLDVISIQDTTPIPHNGPRPKKPRRV